MIDDRDIWAAALAMVKRYGDDAMLETADRARPAAAGRRREGALTPTTPGSGFSRYRFSRHGRVVVRPCPSYRFYYLDSADRVAATEVIYCDTDAQAQARADRLLAATDHPGIEVWDRSQVVYRTRRTDKPS